ncbi:MAG: cupredoxin domain-containing protein [Coriobacteriales bacterium]|nr:cupredoxin domain-containing protein [Coriobacteriales bacterium]
MSRTNRTLVLCVLVTIALTFGATPALAAPVTWQSVNVVLHDETPSPVLLVSGELPKGAKLPAEGVLAAPTGLQLSWIGEVLGGPMEQDPAVTPKVTKTADGDVYAFTVTKGPRAQLELTAPSAVTAEGPQRKAALAWTAPQDLPLVTMQIRVPSNSQIGEATKGAALKPGPTGFQYYERTIENVKAGDKLELAVAFTPPAGAQASGAAAAPAGAPASAPASSSDTLVLAIVIGVLVVVGVALAISVRRKMAEREAIATEARPERKAAASASSSSKRSAGKRGSQPEPEPEPAKRKAPVALVAAGVAVALVVVVLFAVNAGTKPVAAGGKITTQIAQIDQCTSTTFPLNVPGGTKIEDVAEKLFDTLRSENGVGLVTVYTEGQPRIEIGFCESNNTEANLQQVLTPTGFIAGGPLGGAAAPPSEEPTVAKLSSDGKSQTLEVDPSSGSFVPARLEAKAGVPLEISFVAKGGGCATEAIFPDLGATQSFKDGPAKLDLGKLKPGQYAFNCSMGHQSGVLVVE